MTSHRRPLPWMQNVNGQTKCEDNRLVRCCRVRPPVSKGRARGNIVVNHIRCARPAARPSPAPPIKSRRYLWRELQHERDRVGQREAESSSAGP
jgi:hypothetical protein